MNLFYILTKNNLKYIFNLREKYVINSLFWKKFMELKIYLFMISWIKKIKKIYRERWNIINGKPNESKVNNQIKGLETQTGSKLNFFKDMSNK